MKNLNASNVRNMLTDFLTIKAEEEFDFKWSMEFSSWDSGDCSYQKLLAVALMREVEHSEGGVFGDRQYILAAIEELNKFCQREDI